MSTRFKVKKIRIGDLTLHFADNGEIKENYFSKPWVNPKKSKGSMNIKITNMDQSGVNDFLNTIHKKGIKQWSKDNMIKIPWSLKLPIVGRFLLKRAMFKAWKKQSLIKGGYLK